MYLEKEWGIHYSIGGTGSIINALEKLMIEEGIDILRDTEVDELMVQNRKVVGVRCKDGERLDADNVVCNADPPSVYDKMLKNHAKSPFFKLKMARMEYYMGLFVYYFGTKKKYENVQHHTIKSVSYTHLTLPTIYSV